MSDKDRLIFLMEDVDGFVNVEADNEKEAISLAVEDCMEQYDSFYDAEVQEDIE